MPPRRILWTISPVSKSITSKPHRPSVLRCWRFSSSGNQRRPYSAALVKAPRWHSGQQMIGLGEIPDKMPLVQTGHFHLRNQNILSQSLVARSYPDKPAENEAWINLPKPPRYFEYQIVRHPRTDVNATRPQHLPG